jgi:hypothetical protein
MAAEATAFGFGGWHGRVAQEHRPADLRAAVERVIDPAHATETLHWGRNYLYLASFATPAGPLPLAVKQFRNEGWRRRAKRRRGGTKAARSWHAARALLDAGLLTPEPVLLVESDDPEGPSWYACRHLDGVLEARYLLRAANAGTAGEEFPGVDLDAFLVALARTARRLHDEGFWHRDFSSGNVLIRWPEGHAGEGAPPDLYLLDLNRTRAGRRPTVSERSRDLSRMMIHRREHQRRFLDAYWAAAAGESLPAGAECGAAGPGRRALYLLYHHGFRFKNDAKNAVRRRLRGIVQTAKDLLLPRGAHAHIPRAPRGAPTRERVVWDALSDQPHLHAGKLEKHLSRLRDAPVYLRQARAAAAALPRTRARYRELAAARFAEPAPFAGAGVALRPWPDDPQALLAAVAELGVRHVLLRLHPWQESHDEEEALARELAALRVGGEPLDLAFSLPQNRDLVRDPARWRAAVAELAERFVPYGRSFVVGQAVNRSKWGVWNAGEYRDLAAAAAGELRRHEGVEVFGPAVIDFEPLATLGLVNFPGMPRLDGLASLLYVDRRGAPEERQMGFDAAGKATLLRAIADTGRATSRQGGAGRSWITEVNWPLREGPHSPAGQLVAVDEETQADYLVRYFVEVLASGHTERVYWWQMVARGYGLACPEEDRGGRRLRRRPAWRAMRTMLEQLGGTSCEGPLPDLPPAARAYRFRRPDGGAVVVAWTADGGRAPLALPGTVIAAHDRSGARRAAADRAVLGPSPAYFELEE